MTYEFELFVTEVLVVFGHHFLVTFGLIMRQNEFTKEEASMIMIEHTVLKLQELYIKREGCSCSLFLLLRVGIM